MTRPDNNSAEQIVEGKPAPSLPAAAPTALALFRGLRRRWILATGLGVLCAACAAAAGWFLTPMRYTACALLDVAASPPRVVFTTSENRGASTLPRGQDGCRLERVEMFRSFFRFTSSISSRPYRSLRGPERHR